jgi:hypothetical protein
MSKTRGVVDSAQTQKQEAVKVNFEYKIFIQYRGWPRYKSQFGQLRLAGSGKCRI